MKNYSVKFAPWIILILCFALLMPTLMQRLKSEDDNRNINAAVLYNDLKEKVSAPKLDTMLSDYKGIGINSVAVMERDLNSLVSSGEVTCIKYNVLLHKYDDESMRIGYAIEEKCPEITLDSYIVMAKRDKTKEFLSYHIPRRFNEEDYMYIGYVENMDVYAFYDGHKALWDFAIGYDEADLEYIKSKGMDISLIFKVKNYNNTEYLSDIERLIKKYDVMYLNLKADKEIVPQGTGNTDNYMGLAKIIRDNDLTLVVTENQNQLSNQQFYGYKYVYDSVVKTKNESKVIRAFETYDDSQADATNYKYRVSQLFNSTIDRNMRFITITQIAIPEIAYDKLADYTFMAAKEYVQKVVDEGYTVGTETKALDYDIAYDGFAYGLCAVIMIMAMLIMVKLVFEGDFSLLTILAIFLSAAALVLTPFITSKMPSLAALYPTAYSAVMSCFAMTLVLSFLKKFGSRLKTIYLTVCTFIITMASLLIGSAGMGVLLSGIDFYINNEIFRGIKLTLLLPIVYTTVAFYILFIRNKNSSMLKDTFKILNADIKVYWLILTGLVGFVGIYYIIRSGNVESISPIEAAMRSTLTEMFTERPRTKEFLIGYPALILLCYYVKNTKIKLLQWLLAIASSILTASVTNSFCHVFTGYKIIVKRTLNGMIIGLAVAFVAIIANIVVVKIAKALSNKINTSKEV